MKTFKEFAENKKVLTESKASNPFELLGKPRYNNALTKILMKRINDNDWKGINKVLFDPKWGDTGATDTVTRELVWGIFMIVNKYDPEHGPKRGIKQYESQLKSDPNFIKRMTDLYKKYKPAKEKEMSTISNIDKTWKSMSDIRNDLTILVINEMKKNGVGETMFKFRGKIIEMIDNAIERNRIFIDKD